MLLSSRYIDKKKRDILVLGESSTGGLYDTTITAAKYSITFSRSEKTFCLRLHL